MKKEFDCVDMKRKAQEKIFNLTKNMDDKEYLEFWKRKATLFRKELILKKSVIDKRKKIVV
jgi:hypothetical protein